MPRKKKKLVNFEDLGGYVIDDNGVRRDIGTTYPEKFTIRGHTNVFKVYRSGDALAAVNTEGELSDRFIEAKGGWANLTDEDLDRKWEEFLITEGSPPFKVSYTLRSKRRLIQDLYDLGLKLSSEKDKEQKPPESSSEQ